MLPASLDDNATDDVFRSDQQGCYLIFVQKEKFDEDPASEPLCFFSCGDERSLRAVCQWFAVRRALWQAWGEMAEQSGSAALYAHIADLMAAEPFGEVQATLVQKDADPRVLNLGEILMTGRGVREEILYKHRYSTPGKRKRFYDWLLLNGGNGSPERLMDVGTQQGTAALAELLEQIANGQKVNLALVDAV